MLIVRYFDIFFIGQPKLYILLGFKIAWLNERRSHRPPQRPKTNPLNKASSVKFHCNDLKLFDWLLIIFQPIRIISLTELSIRFCSKDWFMIFIYSKSSPQFDMNYPPHNLYRDYLTMTGQRRSCQFKFHIQTLKFQLKLELFN